MKEEDSAPAKEAIEFEQVLFHEDSLRLILEWRNDPVTLAMSFHSQAKGWEVFYQEFKERYFAIPTLPPLFALYHGERVAYLSFDQIAHPFDEKIPCCVLSINVAPAARNRKIGRVVLEAVQEVVALRGFGAIYAEVKVHNLASQKAFLYAGFRALDERIKQFDDGTQEVAIVPFLVDVKSRLPPLNQFWGNRVFIIAEAGSNWRVGSFERDFAMVKTLVDAAKEAGADAVKFQIYRSQTVYVSNAGQAPYLTKQGVEEEIQSIYDDLAMPYEMIPLVESYCRSQGILFIASVFSEADFHAVDPYVSLHKIASYEIGHIHLLRLAALSGKPLLLSTGAATVDEIAWAVNTFKKFGGKELALLQCTANYPAPSRSLNLRVIPSLRERFGVAAGLSDHSVEPTQTAVAAVALGAAVIEKHFTLCRELPGPDHFFALTPPELRAMVQAIRTAEQMVGTGIKTVQAEEEELRSFARRGLQALRPIAPGEVLMEGVNFAILRPGKQPLGAHPRYLDQVQGKRVRRPFQLGEGIHLKDIG